MNNRIRTTLILAVLLQAHSLLAGLPADIQALLATVKKEAVEYPSRASDLNTLRDWLADGDYDLARSKAQSIIQQQRNIRGAKSQGLPTDLRQLLAAIQKDAVEYPSRAGDLSTLRDWLADGDYDLARSKAQSIIKQQRNLRQ